MNADAIEVNKMQIYFKEAINVPWYTSQRMHTKSRPVKGIHQNVIMSL